MAQRRRFSTFFWRSEKNDSMPRCRRPTRLGPSTRPCRVGRGPVEFPGAELAAAVRMQDAPGHVAAAGNRVVERRNRKAGLHPVIDRVANDPVRVHVLDSAQVQLAFVGTVLGEVGQPHSLAASAVKSRRTRSSWAGVPGLVVFRVFGLPNTDHQPLSRQIRHTVRSHTTWPARRASSARNRYPNSGSSRCASKIAFARYASSSSLSVTGLLEPPIVRLACKLQHPTRHRDGDPVGGELTHERVEPFPGRFAWDRYAAARRSTSFSCSNSLIRRRAARRSKASAVVTPGL